MHVGNRRERSFEVALGAGRHDPCAQSHRLCRRIEFSRLGFEVGGVGIGQHRDLNRLRHQLMHELEALRLDRNAKHADASEVRARVRQARNQTRLHGIDAGADEHRGREGFRGFDRERRHQTAGSDNDRDAAAV